MNSSITSYIISVVGVLSAHRGAIPCKEVKELNKTELITAVAEKAALSKKDATNAVDSVLSTIETALKSGNKVQLIGFGNFEVRERSARKGRNPQTGEEIEIKASKVPAFKPGKALKEAVQ